MAAEMVEPTDPPEPTSHLKSYSDAQKLYYPLTTGVSG